MDVSKLSKGPWTLEHRDTACNRGNETHCVLLDPKDNVILDTLNSEVRCIERHDDEDGANYYDEQGERDLEFCALARNAFDVMMRRGWSPCIILPAEKPGRWFVDFHDDDVSHTYEFSKGMGYDEPFTALVEAEKWYATHVEKSAISGR